MQKFSLFLLAFPFIVLCVHCSSGGDSTNVQIKPLLNALMIAGDRDKAKLCDIKKFFVSLESNKSATFPSQEISIYFKKFADVYDDFKLASRIEFQPDLKEEFIELTLKFASIGDELFDLALKFIVYLTDWFIRDPEMLLDSAKVNGVSLIRYLEVITKVYNGATISSNFVLQAVFGLVKKNVKPDEDWGITKDRLKFLENVFCNALNVGFFPESSEIKATISKIKELTTREGRDDDFEEWCDEIGIKVVEPAKQSSFSQDIHLSMTARSLPWDPEALEGAYNRFVGSVESDLQKAQVIFDDLKSLSIEAFPLVKFRELSACEKALNNHANMLPYYRRHNREQIELLEGKFRGVFLGFMRVVSFWFISDAEALLDFVYLNKNISLRILFESSQKLGYSADVLSHILWEMNALPFGLIKVNLDLGHNWNTTGSLLNLLGEPVSMNKINIARFEIIRRLSFLSKACRIHFFPEANGFLEQLEKLIESKLENFALNLESVSAFESWYKCSFSSFSNFLSRGYINNNSVHVVEDNELEESITEVKYCLKSLKEKFVSPFDFIDISLFFDKFEYASFRLNSSDDLDKTKYFNSVLKELVVEFDKEILSPIYYNPGRSGLLNFLKSRNLKLIHLVLKLLNSKGHYDFSIDNNEDLPETIYFNAFQLIENDFYYKHIDSGAEWDKSKQVISSFADILESLPEFVPKGIYAGTSMTIKNYIASLRYLIDNAKFDEKSGIFDVNPLKFALSSIAESKKDSKYHCQVTLVIFYLIQYHERVNLCTKLGRNFLLAMHKVHVSKSYNKTYDNFYNDIGDIIELLLAMKEATFTKTSLDWLNWRKELEQLLRSQSTRK